MPDVMAPGEPVQQLIQAIRSGKSDEVQVLVGSRPELAAARDASGVSVLLLALYHGHKALGAWLASRRADLDIFEAAALGDGDRVETLLAGDPALVHAWSPDGFTALGLASFFGQLAVVRLLLNRGADANAPGRNPGRYNPLTGAVAAGSPDIVQDLLAHGADPNYRYGAGHTPLHEAAARGSLEIVRGLIEAGADVDARTDDGRTPLDLAREKEHALVVELLTGRRRA